MGEKGGGEIDGWGRKWGRDRGVGIEKIGKILNICS